MHGGIIAPGSVIAQEQIVGTAHALLLADEGLDFAAQLGVHARAEDIVKRPGQHFDAGLDDKERDQHAHIGLERQTGRLVQDRAQQHRAGEDRVKARVRARGDQRVRVGLFPLCRDITAQNKLRRDRRRDQHEREQRILRPFGTDDLLDRFDQRGHTGVEHQRRNDHRAEILDPAIAQRVFFVRLSGRELCPHDRDDTRERVG